MKTLYITDMDGTLLDNRGNVSKRSAEIISELTDSGATISVATARTPATVENILAGTRTANDLVLMTGATLWSRPEGCFEGMHLLPQADVELMLGIFRQYGMHPFCYVMRDKAHLDVYHSANKLTQAEEAFVYLRRNLRLKTFHLSEPCPIESSHRVVLFFGMGSKENIVKVAEHLRQLSDCYISYYKDTYIPDLWFLEIFAPGVSKAAGVAQLKKYLGADRVVAFGDNLNDIPMLQMADMAVAVENALPEVKAIAHKVIGPNTDDSVARFIAEDFRNSH